MANASASAVWQVYILKCADASLYTGCTSDIERRIIQHNRGSSDGAKYTRTRRPVELVYLEPVGTRAEACRRELAIKRLSRRAKLQLCKSYRQGDPRSSCTPMVTEPSAGHSAR